jgi:hypothetical protein
MSHELQVPKRRAQVEVLLPGGGARQVTVFLAEFASAHSGPERLSDLLNGTSDFVPAIDAATGAVSFLGRDCIAAARVERAMDPDFDLDGASEHEVEITLVDGTVLRGTLAFVMPPGRARLLDFLNHAQPFVRLAEKEKMALVNKRHIARVAPLS